jgi:hypothetical protein
LQNDGGIDMQKVKWFLISLMTLALIFSSSLAFAWGGGQGRGQGRNKNCPYRTSASQQAGKNRQAAGQQGRGYHKGWQNQGAGGAAGMNKNSKGSGNPRGAQKQG